MSLSLSVVSCKRLEEQVVRHLDSTPVTQRLQTSFSFPQSAKHPLHSDARTFDSRFQSGTSETECMVQIHGSEVTVHRSYEKVCARFSYLEVPVDVIIHAAAQNFLVLMFSNHLVFINLSSCAEFAVPVPSSSIISVLSLPSVLVVETRELWYAIVNPLSGLKPLYLKQKPLKGRGRKTLDGSQMNSETPSPVVSSALFSAIQYGGGASQSGKAAGDAPGSESHLEISTDSIPASDAEMDVSIRRTSLHNKTASPMQLEFQNRPSLGASPIHPVSAPSTGHRMSGSSSRMSSSSSVNYGYYHYPGGGGGTTQNNASRRSSINALSSPSNIMRTPSPSTMLYAVSTPVHPDILTISPYSGQPLANAKLLSSEDYRIVGFRPASYVFFAALDPFQIQVMKLKRSKSKSDGPSHAIFRASVIAEAQVDEPTKTVVQITEDELFVLGESGKLIRMQSVRQSRSSHSRDVAATTPEAPSFSTSPSPVNSSTVSSGKYLGSRPVYFAYSETISEGGVFGICAVGSGSHRYVAVVHRTEGVLILKPRGIRVLAHTFDSLGVDAGMFASSPKVDVLDSVASRFSIMVRPSVDESKTPLRMRHSLHIRLWLEIPADVSLRLLHLSSNSAGTVQLLPLVHEYELLKLKVTNARQRQDVSRLLLKLAEERNMVSLMQYVLRDDPLLITALRNVNALLQSSDDVTDLPAQIMSLGQLSAEQSVVLNHRILRSLVSRKSTFRRRLLVHLATIPTASLNPSAKVVVLACMEFLRKNITQFLSEVPRHLVPALCQLLGRIDLGKHFQDALRRVPQVPSLELSQVLYGADSRYDEVKRMLQIGASPVPFVLPRKLLTAEDNTPALEWTLSRQSGACVGRVFATVLTQHATVPIGLSVSPVKWLVQHPTTNAMVTNTVNSDLTSWSQFHHGVASTLELIFPSHAILASSKQKGYGTGNAGSSFPSSMVSTTSGTAAPFAASAAVSASSSSYSATSTLPLASRLPRTAFAAELTDADELVEDDYAPEDQMVVHSRSIFASDVSKIDRSWIWFHTEPVDDLAQCGVRGGILLGLGLRAGLLRHLSRHDLYRVLSARDTMMTVGLLVGSALSYEGRGEADLHTTRMLSMHIPSLLPPEADLSIAAPIPAAALLSLGILYKNSGHRFVGEILLAEMARGKTALSAGAALGLVFLGKGAPDRQGIWGIPSLFSGGSKKNLLPHLYPRHTLRANALSQGILASENVQPLGAAAVIPGTAIPSFGPDVADLRSDSENGSVNGLSGNASTELNGLDGDDNRQDSMLVPTHETALGAILSLGLMYAGTSDSVVADILRPPSSLFDLSRVRPDTLLLRTCCRAFVQYKGIQLSVDWLRMQAMSLPHAVHYIPAEFLSLDDARKLEELQRQAAAAYPFAPPVPDCSLAVRYALEGAMLAAAIKYACTQQEEARRLFLVLPDSDIALLSCCLVFAGSGDLALLKRVRKRILTTPNSLPVEIRDRRMRVLHSAMGLLFLGGGRFAVDTLFVDQAVWVLLSMIPQLSEECPPTAHLFIRTLNASRLHVVRDCTSNEILRVPLHVNVPSPDAATLASSQWPRSHEKPSSHNHSNSNNTDSGARTSLSPVSSIGTEQASLSAVASVHHAPCMLPANCNNVSVHVDPAVFYEPLPFARHLLRRSTHTAEIDDFVDFLKSAVDRCDDPVLIRSLRAALLPHSDGSIERQTVLGVRAQLRSAIQSLQNSQSSIEMERSVADGIVSVDLHAVRRTEELDEETELIHRQCFELIPPLVRAQLLEKMQTCASKEDVFDYWLKGHVSTDSHALCLRVSSFVAFWDFPLPCAMRQISALLSEYAIRTVETAEHRRAAVLASILGFWKKKYPFWVLNWMQEFVCMTTCL
eukprot:ANDGO_08278.mRNA.1 Anaphase-promoting complex subunit 1